MATAALAAPLDRRGITALSIGHTFNDINQSVVPALLPFLIVQHHLTYAAAAGLMLALTISSSVIQPVFGILTDRRSMSWMIPVGLLTGALGTVLLGIAPSYPWLLAATMVSGVGIAGFHPEASRYANLVSGTRRSTGMGYFALGGNAGFALGPILVTPLLLGFGLHGTVFVVIPGLIVAALLWFELARFRGFDPTAAMRRAAPRGNNRWGAFGVLTATIMLRSMCFFAILTFTPLFFIAMLGATKAQANVALAFTLIAAAGGTIAGGRLADFVDRRRVVQWSMFAVSLLAPLAGLAGVMHAPYALALAAFVVLSFALQWSSSVVIVIGQEYLPTRLGTASGVTLGLAISVGGVAAPLFGKLADSPGFGFGAVMLAVAAIALAAVVCSLFLPPLHAKPGKSSRASAA